MGFHRRRRRLIFYPDDYFCKLTCTLIIYVCFSPALVQLVTSIYAESSGGSQPAEPGVSVKHSFASKLYTVNIYWFNLTQQKKFLNVFLLFQELLEKLKEAEESHGSLQAECEQYRTVLAETVS